MGVGLSPFQTDSQITVLVSLCFEARKDTSRGRCAIRCGVFPDGPTLQRKGASSFFSLLTRPVNKLYTPDGSEELQPQFLLSFHFESCHPEHPPALPPTTRVASHSAPHATSCPTRHLPPSQPLRWVSAWQLGITRSAPSAPHSTPVGLGALSPCPRLPVPGQPWGCF